MARGLGCIVAATGLGWSAHTGCVPNDRALPTAARSSGRLRER